MTLSRFSFCLFFAALVFQDGTIESYPSRSQAQTSQARRDQSPNRSAPSGSEAHAKAERLFSIGSKFLEDRRLDEARSNFEQALRLFEKIGDLKGQAKAHKGLGEIAWGRGELQKALTYFEESLLLQKLKGGESDLQARTLVKLGEVLLAIDQPNEAFKKFEQAFALLGPDGDPEARFEVISGAGMAHLDRGELDGAVRLYRMSLGVAPNHAEKAIAYHRLALAYRLQEDLKKAREALKESIQHSQAAQAAKEVKNRQVEAYAIADLAHLDDLEGEEEKALKGFEQARQIFEEIPLKIYVASTLFGTAEAQRDLKRLDEAIASIETAIGMVESIRSDLDPRLRVNFFAARHRYYDLYIELLMEKSRQNPGAGYAVRAFEAGEQAKARTLLDDMAGESDRVTQGRTVDEIQLGLLDAESVLLAYTLGERGSFLWVVRSNGISVIDLPARKALEDAASKAWSELSEGGGRAEVKSLGRLLLPKEVGPLAGKRLLVSLDGLLHLIPFGMLRPTGDRMLLLEHEITHVPSASVVVAMRQKLGPRPLAPKKFAALFDPVFQIIDPRLEGRGEPTVPEDRGAMDELIGHLGRLAFSKDEVKEVFEYFPRSQTFEASGFEANRKTALDKRLAQFQILHFASHHLAGGHPDFTGLVLSRFDARGRPQPSFLTAPEIYRLNLPTELVVLSACGTGLGQNVRGEGPVGLTRAFLHAGAKRVVVSLWSVRDDATAELMKRFYSQMLKGKRSPAAALHAAQISMHKDRNWSGTSNSWGAFVLQGEPR